MKKDQFWVLRIGTVDVEGGSLNSGKGPVALMQDACKAAGMVWDIPKPGDYFFGTDNEWHKRIADGRAIFPIPLIPADPEPVIEPVKVFRDGPLACPYCQGIKPIGQYVPTDYYGKCVRCGRPESEWTYAPDPQDAPDSWLWGCAVSLSDHQRKNLRNALDITSEEADHLEEDLEELKHRAAIKRLEEEREE